MNDLLDLAPPMGAGLLLGAFFFGGLWWTVIKGTTSERPALWFFGSMLLRTSVTLGGFYLVCRGSWQRWLCCLTGFVVARVAVQLTRPRETAHAP